MDNSLSEIKQCIAEKTSFILEAGAGSGKTWSLIESIKYIISVSGTELEKHNKKIACITYTNVAANEITDRIDNNPLVYVGTIHNFLWSIVGRYTEDIKQAMIQYNDQQSASKWIPELAESLDKVKKIEYNQYKRDYLTGQLWHEDVIVMSRILFNKSKKLALLTINEYPYIFVDEYQDTFPSVIDILLKDIYTQFRDKIVIGFFGDSMQKIYDRGVGNIEVGDYPEIKEITKVDNFRCSHEVIRLLNNIRPELVQQASGNNVEGEVAFYYNSKYHSEAALMERLGMDGWRFEDGKSKVLYLTHRKIAAQGGYEGLLNAFPDRERFFARGYLLALLLFEIEDVCQSYNKSDYASLFDRLNSNGFRVKKHSDKKQVREYIDALNNYRVNESIQAVLDFIINSSLQIFQTQEYISFINHIDEENMADDRAIYLAIKSLPFREVTNCYNYIEKNTIYSTKHGVKGAEFDNVLVIVDDNAWRNFNDNEVFSNNQQNLNRYDRSRNLLYVCCSRSKKRLALYAVTQMSSEAQTTIQSWFGVNNVYL